MTETPLPTTGRSGLYKKLLKAQQDVDYVKKLGFNDFHKYKYATEASILDECKQAANDAGLVLMVSVKAEHGWTPNKQALFCRVDMLWSLIDADTGEAHEGTMPGYAEDAKGDKAMYKAITGAYKYFLLKVFGVPTGEDPEADQNDRDRQAAQLAQQGKQRQENQAGGASPQGMAAPAEPPAQEVVPKPPRTPEQVAAWAECQKILRMMRQENMDKPTAVKITKIESLQEAVEKGQVDLITAGVDLMAGHIRARQQTG